MENHQRYEQLIDELILDEGPRDGDRWQTLRAHLSGCARCRERYDRVALAERMLHGGPIALERPSPVGFDRIGAAVLAQAAPEKRAWARALAWLAPTQRWAVGVATAATLAVLIPFFIARPRGEGGFQARGGQNTERQAGVRAFCLDGGGVTAHCSRSAQLRLTVSNAGRFKYVFLVGLDDQGEIKWYAPRPPQTTSVVAPSGIDVPVGDGVRLGVNHDPGPVRVYAIFSDQPVNASEIEAAVEKLRADHVSPAQAALLPLQRTDLVQRSITFDVEP